MTVGCTYHVNNIASPSSASKIRKRARAEPFESVRHGKRREAAAEWRKKAAANPLNWLSNNQLTAFQRLEGRFYREHKKWPTAKQSAAFREMVLVQAA